jgi:hypothetical protein
MTRAETITYAIDAGFIPMTSEEMDMFVAFAKLIAEYEREACAKLCEDAPEPDGTDLAERIRTRGQA